jgi:hypothetical protein
VYVGLPADASRALGDLVREGRVGLELQPGLMANVAVGVYVMPHARDRFGPAAGTPEAQLHHAEDEEDEPAMHSLG